MNDYMNESVAKVVDEPQNMSSLCVSIVTQDAFLKEAGFSNDKREDKRSVFKWYEIKKINMK